MTPDPVVIGQLENEVLQGDISLCSDLPWNAQTVPQPYFVLHRTDKSTLRLYVDDFLSINALDADKARVILYPLLVPGKNSRRKIEGFIYGREVISVLSDTLAARPIWPHAPKYLTFRRVLVLLNPFSGKKKALKMFDAECRPIFEEGGLKCEVKYTTHVGHAIEIAQTVDLNRYDSVAIVSGDGLVNEFLTGLLTRPDVARALRLPIQHIPGGTSNALAASIAFKSGEPFSPRGGFCREMALIGASPIPAYRRLRLHHFHSAADGRRVMFLSAVWGLLADIDIGSERFRWAGMIRLHMEAAIRIMQLPTVAKYAGTISYLPVTDEKLLRSTRLKWNAARKEFGQRHFLGGEVDTSELNECRPGSPASLDDVLKSASLTCLPEFADPVPDTWTTISGDFVYAAVTSLSHLGSDVPYMPCSTLEENIFYLSFVDWKMVTSRLSIAKMFINFDICSHLDYPCLHVVPVHACRIVPAPDAGGYVAVDGEPCTRGTSFQVAATKFCGTVVARHCRDE